MRTPNNVFAKPYITKQMEGEHIADVGHHCQHRGKGQCDTAADCCWIDNVVLTRLTRCE